MVEEYFQKLLNNSQERKELITDYHRKTFDCINPSVNLDFRKILIRHLESVKEEIDALTDCLNRLQGG
jgi:hypothetical protein